MNGRDPSSPIESLLKLAGERDQPSRDAQERARAAAHASWQRGLGNSPDMEHGRARRRILSAGLAAGVVAAVAAWLWWPESTRPADVARVSAVQGEAQRNAWRAGAGRLQPNDILRSGESFATANGRVALAMGDALSLRVDRDTRLRLEGAGHVTLLQGAVYVDTGGLNARTALLIDTPAGAVRHVGTQFQVRVRDGLTRVQVREGRVVLTQSSGALLDLGAGDLADVADTGVRLARRQPAHGEGWEWASAIAPAFDIENRPLAEFLAWLAREHGWQLRYADAETQSRVQAIRLHGSMSGLEAGAMLKRASMITGVPLSVREGTLLVGAQP